MKYEKLNLENGIKKEWLITNGIGGYASSTAVGINTRRYHGLFIAPLEPPAKRFLILSKLDESIEIEGKRYINGRLEFEGKFLYHRKFNGKGYEEKGNVSYELNNGFGKVKDYFLSNEKLSFEGEYLNGLLNGRGKVYYGNGILKYEGEWKMVKKI